MAVLGLVLVVVGAVIAASEAHVPTHGVTGSVGVLVMAGGVVLAVLGLGAAVWIGVLGGLAIAAVGGGAIALLVGEAVSARRRRVRTGAEGLIGEIGVVRNWSAGAGSVSLHGAVWQARQSAFLDEDDPPQLKAGDSVVVERVKGLTVSVRPAEKWELI